VGLKAIAGATKARDASASFMMLLIYSRIYETIVGWGRSIDNDKVSYLLVTFLDRIRRRIRVFLRINHTIQNHRSSPRSISVLYLSTILNLVPF
jgi:hypothetical protein